MAKIAQAPRRTHIHYFSGVTRRNRNHRHDFADHTWENMPMVNGRHRHRYDVVTDWALNHRHRLYRITGPNLRIGNGRHIHPARGISSPDFNHRHRYEFRTRRNVPYPETSGKCACKRK